MDIKCCPIRYVVKFVSISDIMNPELFYTQHLRGRNIHYILTSQ